MVQRLLLDMQFVTTCWQAHDHIFFCKHMAAVEIHTCAQQEQQAGHDHHEPGDIVDLLAPASTHHLSMPGLEHTDAMHGHVHLRSDWPTTLQANRAS